MNTKNESETHKKEKIKKGRETYKKAKHIHRNRNTKKYTEKDWE